MTLALIVVVDQLVVAGLETGVVATGVVAVVAVVARPQVGVAELAAVEALAVHTVVALGLGLALELCQGLVVSTVMASTSDQLVA